MYTKGIVKPIVEITITVGIITVEGEVWRVAHLQRLSWRYTITITSIITAAEPWGYLPIRPLLALLTILVEFLPLQQVATTTTIKMIALDISI